MGWQPLSQLGKIGKVGSTGRPPVSELSLPHSLSLSELQGGTGTREEAARARIRH